MRHARHEPGFLRSILDLVHPLACAACGEPSAGLCPECAAGLAVRPFAHRPRPCPPGCPPVYAACAYDGVARRVVIGWKERGHRGAVEALGALLAAAIARGSDAEQVDGPLLLVPVPSSVAARRARGEDVLMRVTRRAGAELRAAGRIARVQSVLALSRTPDDQAGLDAGARMANLRGAMTARDRRAGGEIVVVDDVVTTGATLVEATRALALAGHPVGFAATIAATLRRGRL
ncbi:MAG: ComF family protein [Candidatus Nanopelagicales bacterium]